MAAPYLNEGERVHELHRIRDGPSECIQSNALRPSQQGIVCSVSIRHLHLPAILVFGDFEQFGCRCSLPARLQWSSHTRGGSLLEAPEQCRVRPQQVLS